LVGSKYILRNELANVGIQALKGRLEMGPKMMRCEAFLEAIYIKNPKAKS